MSASEDLVAMLEEILGLVGVLADVDDFVTLSDEERRIVDVARSAVGLAQAIARAKGGDVGSIVATVFGALPVEDLAQWLSSFRTLVVKLREASLTVGEGVDATVDLDR